MNTEPHNFYVTLPSNTSTDTFPNNTPSEYTARLSHRIELSGEWEVALHTISYVKWNTIKLNKESVHYVANSIKKTGSQLKDYYANVKEYIADINECKGIGSGTGERSWEAIAKSRHKKSNRKSTRTEGSS